MAITMDWLLTNPQIHSTFSSLGVMKADSYVVSPEAVAILEEINCKLTCEDQTLRTFRRGIGFGQNVKTDLVPLLINVKDPDILDATIRILVNLTVPVECLFSVDIMYRTDVGRHTIFELNKLLITSKEAFTDPKSTKAIVDYMKCILESDTKLSANQCESINNCLLLLRNILHIPENNATIITAGHHSGNNCTSMQNIILWNLFIQSIDKLLIYLMSCSQRAYWGVTMVQLIAIMYKDQHVSTLQKLLNVWFESSLSESSEDNESNTSPPKQGSGDSSPMLTSDPTSDSSDNGGSQSSGQYFNKCPKIRKFIIGKYNERYHRLGSPLTIVKHSPMPYRLKSSGKQESAEERRQTALSKETESTLQQVSRKGHEYQNAIFRVPAKQQSTTHQNTTNHQAMSPPKHPIHGCVITKDAQKKNLSQTDMMHINHPSPKRNHGSKSPHTGHGQLNGGKCSAQKRECPSSQSELSDCGYGTQVENQESVSTSSNDDDELQKKPVHQKPPCNQKQRYNANNKSRSVVTAQDKKEWRRKKLVKRSKSSLINMKGLIQHIPTDEDISNILKEFTVDFLLKGYGYLVQELHAQLLSDLKVQIDTSHFFWLVTYFLKFAAQLELDLEHISSVLSFDVVSYLTFEGVCLCEQLELTSSQHGSDLRPYLRRMHLVVTAIREFLQALESYKKITHLSKEDRQYLRLLQIQICSTADLRCLFILLIRRYDPVLHSKQYLQDLIVTNHMLLLLLDGVTKTEDNRVNVKMMGHIAQFATAEIMHHYGLLLEDFRENGEFVNDCIFTMMHHIAGDLGKIGTLFQPVILKTYSKIWETEYELCDDWSDLIEYIIHKFMNTPRKSSLALPSPSLTEMTKEHNMEHTVCTWSQEEMDTLYWYYVQSKKTKDVVGKMLKLFDENGKKQKARLSIVQQLLHQDIITLAEYDDLMKFEDAEYQRLENKTRSPSASTVESGIEIKDSFICKTSDDIQVLKDRLLTDNKGKELFWLQKILIECCIVKLNIKAGRTRSKDLIDGDDVKIMEPVLFHCILKKKSIPIVPWNSEQASVMLYQPFVLLLHKLGFHLPSDAGKIFARIPDFWSADILYNVAQKIGPLDNYELAIIKQELLLLKGAQEIKIDTTKSGKDSNNDTFAIPRMKQSNSMIRFTPDPASTPSVPNWLQLVMRGKCTTNDRYELESTISAFPSVTSLSKPSTSKVYQTCILSDEDSAIRSMDDFTDCSLSRRRSSNLDSEYSALIASEYEENEFLSYETASVASDLTRMCVSDEEEKNDRC